MKLEVGMFVRTNKGKIIKVNRYEEQINNPMWETLNGVVQMKGTIKKSSHNIIDLIEVGDYVNGYKVISKPFYDSGYITFGLSNNTNFDSLCEIKEVLTHEQYEANCYKIGE